jgi:hypothetical protein
MTTFSQIVDEVAKELIRPDIINMLPGFLNQVMRESHNHAQTKLPVLFNDNRNESEIIIDAVQENGSFLWAIPDVARFQRMESIYYVSNRMYALHRDPTMAMRPVTANLQDKFYWYRSGPAIAMFGAGRTGAKILVSWFKYTRSLTYYALGESRPLSYNRETDTYVQPDSATENLADALNKTTNWLIQRHEEMLKSGLRAKAYTRMDDLNRARSNYSIFMSMLEAVQETEASNLGNTHTS